MHLTIKERLKIEILLKENKSIKEIADIINVSYHRIFREINNRKILFKNTKRINLGNEFDNIEILCLILNTHPKVCNKCPRYLSNTCTYDYLIYDANEAQKDYDNKRGKRISLKKEKYLNEVSIRINKGQPISHIHSSMSLKYNDMISKKSIYNWIDEGLIKYNKKKIKIPKNNEKILYEKSNKIDRLVGMDYERFLSYTSDNPRKTIVEIDLVEGCRINGKSSGYILTMFIPSIQFMLGFKLNSKTPQEVIKVFDNIEKNIGFTNFRKIFGIMLSDRGSEFLKYKEITRGYTTKSKRCEIFYCDPAKPYQKANVENIHRILRRYIPKGTSLERYKQDDINFMISNINSLIKEKYGNKTPIEMFKARFGKTLLSKLSIEEIFPEDVSFYSYTL